MSQPELSVVKCDHIHRDSKHTCNTNTLEVHGFRQRLQDSLLHMLLVSVPWVVLVLTLMLFRFIGFGESGACFGTGSEAVPWGHVNGPSERRVRPAFLQPRALDGTALTIGPSKNCPVIAIYWAGVGQWRHRHWRSASVHRSPTLKRTHIANCAI